MSGLDRIKVPAGNRWLYALIFGVIVFIGLTVSADWWVGGAIWKLVVAAALSALLGAWIGRAVVHRLSPRRRR